MDQRDPDDRNLNVQPVLQAFVLADHIYMDASSGKKVIAGTFNHLTAPSLPGQFSGSKYAFVALTDLHGELELSLRFVDLNGGETLFELRGLRVESKDPLATVELVVEIPELPMPHEGVFAFEIHAAGQMIGMVRLFISSHEEERRRAEA